jgi:hypothetical protein
MTFRELPVGAKLHVGRTYYELLAVADARMYAAKGLAGRAEMAV